MELFKKVEVKTTKLMAHELKEVREKYNIGLRELSRMSGVSPALISLLENGKSGASETTAERIEIAIKKIVY